MASFTPLVLYFWGRGWVGPRATLDTVEKRKTLARNQFQIPQLYSLSPVTILTELSQLLDSR
jgi:hypothetical protein